MLRIDCFGVAGRSSRGCAPLASGIEETEEGAAGVRVVLLENGGKVADLTRLSVCSAFEAVFRLISGPCVFLSFSFFFSFSQLVNGDETNEMGAGG